MQSLPHPNGALERRVAVYARVSTEDQADRGTIQAQLTLLRTLAQAYGWDVADEYVDDGVSGTIPLDRRPEGARLVADAREGRFAEVVSYRLDRLGRSLRALLDSHDALERAGVTIRSATEPFDTSTPIGKFLFQLLGGLAELERRTITERMTMGRDRVAREGRWTCSSIPFGYDLDEAGCLVPSQRPVGEPAMSEAALVRDVFERVAAGASLVQECRRLNALGVVAARRYAGGRTKESATWFPSRLSKMIRGTLYTGSYVLNSRNGPFTAGVPPLVSHELAEAARAGLKRNLRRPKGRTTRTYLLRGLMVCGCCGLYYGGAVVGPRRPTHAAYHYYRCAGMHAYMRPDPENRCRSKALPAEWLEERIWQDVRGFILEPGEPLEEARAELRRRLARATTADDQRDALRQRVAEKEAERELVTTLFRRKKIRLDEAERQLDELAAEADALRAQLAAVQAEDDVTQAFEAQLIEATGMLESLRAQLGEIEQTNDLVWKRRIIELLVGGIHVETTARPDGKKEARLEVRYVFGRPRRQPVEGVPTPVPAPEEPAFAAGCPRSSAGTTGT